jgi:hypothetical protein
MPYISKSKSCLQKNKIKNLKNLKNKSETRGKKKKSRVLWHICYSISILQDFSSNSSISFSFSPLFPLPLSPTVRAVRCGGAWDVVVSDDNGR